MATERRHAAELQARLSASVQEKLKSECERGRLALDLQHLQEQLELHQEELATVKEALSSHRAADGSVESRILPGETSDYENLEEVTLIMALAPPKLIDLELNLRTCHGNNFLYVFFNIHTCVLFVDLTSEEAGPAADPHGGGATAGGAAPTGPASSG